MVERALYYQVDFVSFVKHSFQCQSVPAVALNHSYITNAAQGKKSYESTVQCWLYYMQYDGVQYDSVQYSVFWCIAAKYGLLQWGRVRLLLVLCHFGTFPVVCHFVQFPGQINFSGPMLRPHKSVLTTAFQKLHQFKAIKQIFAKWLQL